MVKIIGEELSYKENPQRMDLKRASIWYIALLLLFFLMTSAISVHATSGHVISDCGGDGACIPAHDFGMGGFVCVPAAPSDNYPLIKSEPKSQQIAKWIDTGLYTLGNPPSSSAQYKDYGDLKIMVNGGWNPWGYVEGVDYDLCNLKDCNPNDTSRGICINKGDAVGKVVDDSDLDKLPCLLLSSSVGSGSTGGGWGLYGLIAMTGADNTTADPNDIAHAETLPPSLFRTFRVSPMKKGSQVNNPHAPESEQFEYYFDLKHTQKCSAEDGCIIDKYLGNGADYVVRGKLYFKILDSYYQDNAGSYTVNVIKGVYSPNGFIENTVGRFQNKIKHIIDSLLDNIIKNSGFLSLVRAMILLYVTCMGALFMLGMSEMNQKELLIKSFKVVVVSMLLSEKSWDFFAQDVFVAFQQTIEGVGSIIINATLFYDDGMPIYQMPSTATPLSVYDLMLGMITKLPIHAKTLSMLFYRWKLYWIPAIYICIAFILISILKSLVMYLVMFMQMGMLLLIAPIFILALLFNTTKELFEAWLKQVISTGILYVMIAVTVALMMKIVVGQLEALLSYRVCWQSVWKLTILWIDIFDLKFWYPSYDEEVDSALNALNFLKFLIASVLFFGLMSEIPQLADVLGGSARFASNEMFGATYNTARGIFSNAVSMANRINPIGRAVHGTMLAKGLDRFRKTRDDVMKRGAIALITNPGRGPRTAGQALKEDWKPFFKVAPHASSTPAPDAPVPDAPPSHDAPSPAPGTPAAPGVPSPAPPTSASRDAASSGDIGGGSTGSTGRT